MHAAAAAAAGSAMETNKVLHFVPSGKWTGAAAQLSTTRRSPGEPRGSLPLKPENPLTPPHPVKNMCSPRPAPPPAPPWRTTDVWLCVYVCVCVPLCFWRESLFFFFFFSEEVWLAFFPSLTTRSLFFFLFCSLFTCGMRHQRLLHRIS